MIMLIALLVIMICPFGVAQSHHIIQYKIKRGDTLTSIASKYDVSVTNLQKWNSLRSQDQIYQGQRIKIKKGAGISPKKRVKLPTPPNFKFPANAQSRIKGFIFRYNKKFPGVLWELKNSIVKSSRYGKIIEKGYLRGYGHYVIIDHGKGWLSFYSNLSKIFVNKGNIVSSNFRIGIAKNKKLFFSISHRGQPLDPILILNGIRRRMEAS